MKGFAMLLSTAKFLPALFVLLIINNGSVEAIFTMNQTCAYFSQGYIANPNDCQSWGYCSGGTLKHTGKCPKGFLYDTARGICNYASDVQCGTTASDNCANLPDPGYVAVPNDCNQYCYCSNQKLLECNSCPKNQVFNPKILECVRDYSCPIDSICRLVPNNAFVGSPIGCGEFIRCLDGSGIPQQCSNNKYYNPLTGYCQAESTCLPSGNPSPGDSPSTYPPDPNQCNSYDVSKGKIQYYPDTNTCYGYYSCKDRSGSGTWRSCPLGTQFDASTQQCVSPTSVICAKNRCANINAKFMTQPFSACKNYYVCENNQESTESYLCPPDYPYFDEVNQGCVNTDPGYKICQPSSV